jgi:chromosome segregation ATPase
MSRELEIANKTVELLTKQLTDYVDEINGLEAEITEYEKALALLNKQTPLLIDEIQQLQLSNAEMKHSITEMVSVFRQINDIIRK